MAYGRPHEHTATLKMTIPALIFTYVTTFLAALSAAAIYSEMRRRRFEPTGSTDRIFRCDRCGSVYTDDADMDRSRCMQCGQVNQAFEF